MVKHIREMWTFLGKYGFWFVFTAAHFVHAQLPEMQPIVREGIPEYYFDVVTFASEDSGKCLLQFYSKVSYDELQFIQVDNQYQAEYEVSIVAFNKQGNQENGKILKRQVVVDRFASTNSITDFDMAEIEFPIVAGEYELLIELMDLDTRKTGYQKINIVVPDYKGSSFNASDFLLSDTVTVDVSGNYICVPNVVRNFESGQSSLFLYYEIYNKLPIDSVKVVCEIQDEKEKTIRKETHYKILDGPKTADVIQVARGDLESGRYQLVLKIGKDDYLVERRKDFTVRWTGLPAAISDLNKAIEQLRYIADGDEIKKMRNAEDEEKQRLFIRFWNSKDPTPGTRNNENMEEYYRRVQFANEAFGQQNKGWETDRGMVFITLGAPDDVERHPFDSNTYPYEIWRYYRWNTYFIFQSLSGYGEMRLVNPEDFWDVVNRIK